MDSRIEVSAENTLFILGPHFAASLSSTAPVGDAGEVFRSVPPLSCVELVSNWRESGADATTNGILEWVEKNTQECPKTERSPLLEQLIELQCNGALIAYSYVDTTVSVASSQPIILPGDAPQWISGETRGILHLFGACTTPDSIRAQFSENTKEHLLPLLKKRTCLMIGFETSDERIFLDQIVGLCKEACADPILISTIGTELPRPQPLIPLLLPEPYSLVLAEEDQATRSIGQAIEAPAVAVDQSVGLTLLFKEKKAALNAVTAAPGISFAFMSEVKVSDANVHCLSLRVNTDKMADFWNWLVTKGSHAAQQRLNVLGVLIQSSCFLYLNDGKTALIAEVHNSEEVTSPQRLNLKRSLSPQKSTGKKVPRYTVQKFSIHGNKKFRESANYAPTNSILARRLSLPPLKVLPQPDYKNGTSTKTSDRHTFLLSKFIFTNKKTDFPVAPIGTKMLKNLLQKPNNEPVYEPPPLKSIKTSAAIINEMTFKRRKNLFINDSQNWSENIDDQLKKKIKKWEQLRMKRKLALMKKNQDRMEELSKQRLQESTDENTMLKQQLTSPPIAVTAIPPLNGYQNGLFPQTAASYLTGVNSLLVPHPGAYYPNLLPYPLLGSLPVNYPPYLMSAAAGCSQSNKPGVIYLPGVPAGTGLSLASSTNTPSTSLSSQTAQVPPPQSYALPQFTPLNGTVPLHNKAQLTSYPNISSLLLNNNGSVSPPKHKQEAYSPPTSNAEGADSQKQLWQFLLELLLSGTAFSHVIHWTGSNLEFKIHDLEEVSELWAKRMNTRIDVNQFQQALHYYSSRTHVLSEVKGCEFTYKFHPSISTYINMHYSRGQTVQANNSTDSCKTEVLVVD